MQYRNYNFLVQEKRKIGHGEAWNYLRYADEDNYWLVNKYNSGSIELEFFALQELPDD